MSRIGKIARRTFLVGTAAIAGGVAFGYYQYRRDLPNPLEDGIADGDTTLNPYILLSQEGITLIAPRAEMGQGIQTTLAALVAEELDVAWDEIRVEHGPPGQAYFNAALMSHALPTTDYDRTAWQETMIEAMSVLPRVMALQVTGGSTSTLDAFERMRMAGAVARRTLLEVAAQRFGASPDTLRTEDGAVLAPDGTRVSYADLAVAAAELGPVTSGVRLKDPSDWRYLGRSLPRVDMVEKVTGTARFATDVRLPGLRFATVRMSPRLGGDMTGFDATDARAMDGVERILDLGTGIAVVANNTWTAVQAAERVEIDWGEAPYPATTDEMFEAIAAAFDDPPNSTLRDEGNADMTPDGATLIDAEYRVPWLAHSTMEPMTTTALFEDGNLTLWTGSQAPILVAQKAAEALGIDAGAVTVNVTFLGGGFGRRGETDFAVQAARIAAEMPGTPVAMTWSREEDMRHDFYRPAAMARFRGVVRPGEILTLDGAVSAPSVTRQSTMRLAGFSPPGADKGHVEGVFNQPYALPNYRVRGHLADLDVPIGFWRSVGNSFGGFFMESFMDELIRAADLDPLEARIALAESEHAPSAGVLRRVGEMCDWQSGPPDGVGRGLAFTHSFHTPAAVVIDVSEREGRIALEHAWMACDVGTALDPAIIESQMVSGLIYGLSAAIMGEITFADGEVQQWNYPDYDALRIHQVPPVEVAILETQPHLGGVGEPGTPPSMPALANALFDLTGERVRELPLNRRFDFVI